MNKQEINRVHYAGSSGLRYAFLQHIATDRFEVIATGGGTEANAVHPLPIAREKILFVRNQESPPPPSECFVAFDTVTYIPTIGNRGLYFEASGKPENDETVQRFFWDMKNQEGIRPYRIRSASVLWCNGEEHSAWHDASISLSERGVAQLATDRGMAAYTLYIEEFEHQFGNQRAVTDFAAGLHLETFLAMGYVEAIDDVPQNQTGFEIAAERAIFLASVGASHRILGPLTHEPMNHIITFPHHLDRLALLGKYTGAT